MKLTSSLLLVTMLTGIALAQAPANKNATSTKPAAAAPAKPVTTAAKPATAVPAKPATAVPAKPAVAATSATAKPTMPATKPEHTAAKPHAKSKSAAKAHTAVKKAPISAKPAAAAKAGEPLAPESAANIAPEIERGRDPFVSVIRLRTGGVSCAGAGKKCLIVDQVTLKGVVRSQGESIAVVTSDGVKTYFLRENDPVYNGLVVKITPDSIVFRETVTDRLGKSIQREVVKKVNNSAV